MPHAQTTILLVDESRFFLSIEKQFLRNVPAAVLEAQSASQALSLCRATPPQLIFLADVLADGDGHSCCRQLKADPALADIPVILVCEDVTPAARERHAAVGCSAVLSKPLDRHSFLEAGRKFVAGIREARRPCQIGVMITQGSRMITTKGLDISSGGLFCEGSEDLAVGSELVLDLHLARPHEAGDRIRCVGVVAWLNERSNPTKAHHPAGFGIKFTKIPPLSAEVLAAYLQKIDQQKKPG